MAALLLCFTTALLFLHASAACGRCVQSKTAFFSTDQSLQSGACGYGSLALGFNDGHLAAATPAIYKKGAGCGSCFQVRCKNEQICSKQGTGIIVTDLNNDNNTAFVVSKKAFAAMAKPGKSEDVINLGIADVEYKRVPCVYNKNLSIRVEESSHKPHYLAIKFLYLGGQTEIVSVDVAQVGTSDWSYMSRNYGAVWDTSKVPKGGLQFRVRVTAGFDGKFYWAKNVMPADWKNGVIYDTGFKIYDVAQEGCSPCMSPWK